MKLFKKKNKNTKRPTPDEIVAAMRGKDLQYIDGNKVIDVIYSPDSMHRFVIIESCGNFLTYSFESLHISDEEDLLYTGEWAYWLSQDYGTKPVFDDINILLKELKTTPEYRTFFDGI